MREILPIMSVMSVMDECIVEGTWELCMGFFLTCICRFIKGGEYGFPYYGNRNMGLTWADEEGSLSLEV